MRASSLTALAAIAAFGTTGALRAQDEERNQDEGWRRFHVGVAVGESHLAPSLSSTGAPPEVIERFGDRSPPDPTGWKLVAGFRPARVVGVEVQFIDFGTAEIPPPSGHGIVRTHVDMESSADATVLTALLFIPKQSPAFDVYGKIGVGKLNESFRAHALVVEFGSPCYPFPCSFSTDKRQSDAHPYFAIGFRHEIGRAAAFRVEYETIHGDAGDDTTMFSAGVAWER